LLLTFTTRCKTDDELFAKILVVLIGDRCQLPPVCRHQLRIAAADDAAPFSAAADAAASAKEMKLCQKCHLGFSYHWANGEHHNLDVVHRFSSDQEWLVFLNIIRVRRPTEEEIERTLGPLFVEDEEARAWVISNTTVITSHHAQRGRHGRVLHVQAHED
jgi:hypothetical protein